MPRSLLAVKDIINKSGFSSLYNGWAAYIVLCLKPAITYAVFDKLKDLILRRKSKMAGRAARTLSTLEAFVIGAVARGIATFIVFPYTRAKVSGWPRTHITHMDQGIWLAPHAHHSSKVCDRSCPVMCF